MQANYSTGFSVYPQSLRKECPDLATLESQWECPRAAVFRDDSLWRIALLFNAHLLRNPYLGQLCFVQDSGYEPPGELWKDRLYLATGSQGLLLQNESLPVSARSSVARRALRVHGVVHGEMAECDTFDLVHILECHVKHLEFAMESPEGWEHWLL